MRHLIFDGLNIFIRSFVVNPTMDVNGDHAGGLMGFLGTINKLVREVQADYVYVVWDGEGGSWKRRSLYKDYKAGRKPRLNREYGMESPEEQLVSMKTQLMRLDRYLNYLPIRTLKVKGLEADDVIAYLVGHEIPHDDEKVIVSSDKDFYQLLDSKTSMYVHTKKKYYTANDMTDELSVLPENYIIMKCLTGDGSDNIEGIRGIGPKTVVKLFPFLLERRATLDEMFEHAELGSDDGRGKAKYRAILENRELVIGNERLMQLSNPFMSPMAARSIRYQVREITPKYRPTDMRLQLTRDGLQIKASDFFSVFKEQMHRSKNTTH